MLHLSKKVFSKAILPLMEEVAEEVGITPVKTGLDTDEIFEGKYTYLSNDNPVSIRVIRDLNTVVMWLGHGDDIPSDRQLKRIWKIQDLENPKKFINQLRVWYDKGRNTKK